MPDKPIILVAIDWYLPAFKGGGPIQSVANIISHLGHLYQFRIITGDRDLRDKKPFDNITFDKVILAQDNTATCYISKPNQTYGFLQNLISHSDANILYLNSMFSVKFSLLPLLISKRIKKNMSVIIAPRGMLADGALSIKPIKKKIFLHLAKSFGWYRNVIWHASTELESTEIKKIFGDTAIVKVARNLSHKQNIIAQPKQKEKGTLRLAFLSRIARKKNLLAVFDYMQNTNSMVKIIFDIYGNIDEPDYWQQCETKIKNLPAHVKCNYKGEVPQHLINTILLQYDFTILPTLNENYGHAIVESWSAGCPVILSDNTPWRNLEQQNLGWDINLSRPEQFTRAIDKCVDIDNNDYNKMSNACFIFAQQVVNNNDAVQQNIELFNIALNKK